MTTTTENIANDPVEDKTDDAALYDVACYLMEKTGQTQDPRIAEILEKAIEICQKDPQLIAKLFLELNKWQKQAATAQQEPFNPFVPPVQRGVPR